MKLHGTIVSRFDEGAVGVFFCGPPLAVYGTTFNNRAAQLTLPTILQGFLEGHW